MNPFVYSVVLLSIFYVSAAQGKKDKNFLRVKLQRSRNRTFTGLGTDPSRIDFDFEGSSLRVLAEKATEISLNSSSTAIPSPLGSGARIANGKKAPKGAIPFAAYIEIESYEGIYTCGGSLIAPRVLVTAAHCFFSDSGNSLATSALAAIGETDISRPSRVYEILEVIRPTDYAPAFTYELYGDIAVALLDRRANRKPVTMGSSKTKIPKYYITAGWGLTEKDYSPDELMYAAVPSLSLRQVNSWAASSGLYYSMEEDKMAAGLGSDRADSCQGDSGGPLFIPGKDKFTNAESRRNILMGVVSYGLSSACGGRNRNIGFYTSIPYWRNWIKDAISSNKWK